MENEGKLQLTGVADTSSSSVEDNCASLFELFFVVLPKAELWLELPLYVVGVNDELDLENWLLLLLLLLLILVVFVRLLSTSELVLDLTPFLISFCWMYAKSLVLFELPFK